MSHFWADRQPLPHETGAHLTGNYAHAEIGISHLAMAVTALAPMSLSQGDRKRVGVLVEQLNKQIGE